MLLILPIILNIAIAADPVLPSERYFQFSTAEHSLAYQEEVLLLLCSNIFEFTSALCSTPQLLKIPT